MQRFFYIILLFFIFVKTNGQLNLHYFNHEILQSNYLNPSNIPSCKVNIGIPVINGIAINMAHSGFTYNDLFTQNPDNTVTPNLQDVLNKIGNINYINSSIDLSLFFIGIEHKDYYFNFSIRERIFTDVFYNNHLLRLAVMGNAEFEGKTATLKRTGLQFNYFRQYSLGLARKANEYLNWGVHANILFGKGNMFVNTGNTSLFTENVTYALTANADANYHSSLPFIITNNNGFQVATVDVSPSEFLLNRENKGLTFDAGFNYLYNGDTRIYGSILDLGLIRYKTNTTNIDSKGEFNYTGPRLDNQNITAYYNELINSADDSIDINLDHEPYFYAPPARLYLGMNRNYSQNLTYGILTNATAYKQKVKLYVGLHAGYQLGKHVNTMLSWSYANRSIKNVGAGFSFFFNPFNFYLVSDNIPGIIWLRSTKSLNLQFGFNLRFGCKEKKEKGGFGCDWSGYPKSYQERVK